MHLFVTTTIMITTSNSSIGGARPSQLLGVLLHTMAISELARVRTELLHLLVIPLLAAHPVQTNR